MGLRKVSEESWKDLRRVQQGPDLEKAGILVTVFLTFPYKTLKISLFPSH